MEFWQNAILGYVVPLVSIAFSYYLGRHSNQEDYRRKVLQERYVSAYVPYLNMLYKGFHFNHIIIDDNDHEARAAIFDLLTKNIQHWDKRTLERYPYFHRSYLTLLDFEKNNAYYSPYTPMGFTIQLNKITLTILEDATKLSDELQLPRLSAPFLEGYRDFLNALDKSEQPSHTTCSGISPDCKP